MNTFEEQVLSRLDTIMGMLEGRAAAAAPRPRKRSRQLVMAENFVRVQLLDGPKAWGDIVAAGEKCNHREITLRRARDAVAVHRRVEGRVLWFGKETRD